MGGDIKMKFQYNDGGRKAAGFKMGEKIGDCAVRAVAIATEQPYGVVYDELLKIQDESLVKKMKRCRSKKKYDLYAICLGTLDRGTYRWVVKEYLLSRGWSWTPTMKIGSGCKVHLCENELPKGRIVCNVSKHYVAIIDGVINDTFNPSREGDRCVYGYYTKEESNK